MTDHGFKASAVLLGAVLLWAAPVPSMGETAPAEGQLTIETPKPETKIRPKTPIVVEGTHSLPKDARVWLFLRDVYGGYYLQNPSVELYENGRWEHANTIPGNGIRHIVAVLVDDRGHLKLGRWAEASRFGRIAQDEVESLPGFRELDRVVIVTPR